VYNDTLVVYFSRYNIGKAMDGLTYGREILIP